MHRDSKLYALVEDKHSQLEKCPTVRASTFSLRARQLISSFPNSRKLFECNRLNVHLSLLDNSIRNGVINIGLESL